MDDDQRGGLCNLKTELTPEEEEEEEARWEEQSPCRSGPRPLLLKV